MEHVTPADLPARFVEKIAQRSDGCWEWIGFVQDNGYGKVSFEGRVWLAHRACYTMLVGRIPEGLVLDHLCRNRRCVNPHHLRAVTQRENCLAPGSESPAAVNAAKTTCPYGHPLTGTVGQRRCLSCANVLDRKRWPRRSAIRSERNQQRWTLTPDAKARLDHDIMDAFKNDERLTTPELVGRLMQRSEWRTHLEPMSDRSRSIWLGRMIGVHPRTHKFGARTTKGYRIADIAA